MCSYHFLSEGLLLYPLDCKYCMAYECKTQAIKGPRLKPFEGLMLFDFEKVNYTISSLYS